MVMEDGTGMKEWNKEGRDRGSGGRGANCSSRFGGSPGRGPWKGLTNGMDEWMWNLEELMKMGMLVV